MEILTEYTNKKDLKESLDSLKKEFPEVQTSYKPSGKIVPSSIIKIFFSFPVITLFVFICCYLGFLILLKFRTAERTFQVSRDFITQLVDMGNRLLLGRDMLLIDMVLFCIIVFMPGWLYSIINKWAKSRNIYFHIIPALITSFLAAIFFFWPIWGEGKTLAPTDLAWAFVVPIKPIIIVFAGFIGPVVAGLFSYRLCFKNKYCEITGVWLKRIKLEKGFSFKNFKEALDLLNKKQYQQLERLALPEKDLTEDNPYVKAFLWWNEHASTAYFELKMIFHADVISKKDKSLKEREVEDWLIYSDRIDSELATQILDILRN